MAGMIPDKKTIQEIERDYETLRTRHDQLVERWLRSRFEPAQTTDENRVVAKNEFVDQIMLD
ncbi:MAG: hypothetical protein WDN01_15300 [Rhizomicrobium sp.]